MSPLIVLSISLLGVGFSLASFAMSRRSVALYKKLYESAQHLADMRQGHIDALYRQVEAQDKLLDVYRRQEEMKRQLARAPING